MAGSGEQEQIPHVLIVEDDILSDLLQEEEFVAAVYSTAREALEDFRKGEFTAGSDEPPKYVYVNPAFARMTGYSEGELLGWPPSLLYGLKTSRTVLDRLESLQSQGRSFVGDMILYRQDGSTFAIEARIDAVKDSEGRITHWVAIYR